MRDPLLLLAGALGATAVALGAFGAHALSARLGPALSTWQTGVQYHLFHSVALLGICALAAAGFGPRELRWAGWLMVLGVTLFSGSLYLLALGGPRWLGPVTPLGGLAFVLAWSLVAVAAWRQGS
ncbi:MAG: DUF423 domain-containing protein [Pseudomonadales bacterium]|jgi:uncharacterized membrane protein YgdD (TMEM256/DUF423 family)|nr:DUF423 domain-containing protein [Pseudomonadales bacterium]